MLPRIIVQFWKHSLRIIMKIFLPIITIPVTNHPIYCLLPIFRVIFYKLPVILNIPVRYNFVQYLYNLQNIVP